jgi:uncharacterized peroxidase-related enzyme
VSRIKVIHEQEAEGRLKEIYDQLTQSRGKLAEVHKIQSLRPESIVKHMELYMEIMFSKSELSRARREMIAVVVSVANQCEYCQIHHSSALNHYWKNEQKVQQLRNDFKDLDLSKDDLALCEYAQKVTLNPGEAESSDVTQILKSEGFSDSAILDATLVVSYFNFVNRMVLSLGVGIESDEGQGYKY